MKDSKEKKKNNNTKKKNMTKKSTQNNTKNVEQKKVQQQKNIHKKADIKEKKKKRKLNKQKILQIILLAILGCMLLGIIAVALFMMIIIKDAPEFNPKNLFTQESSIVYDTNGNQIAKLGTEKREKIEYNDMPQILIDAIVATEDSTFFQHNGFNAARFLKASFSQVLGGGGGGASTLTMQVSKNAYTSNVANGFEGIKRKFTDIYLATEKIEKTYTKEEIMEFYVNSYYMGGGAYGVEQACQNYFNKSVNNINLAEAAMIAGIYQAPGKYDPTINPENTEARRKTVLNLMLRHGYITKEEKEIAEKLTVEKILHPKNTDGDDQVDPRYKDFIDTVVEDVKEKTGYNPYTTSMLIYTTIDNEKQEYVTNLMKNFNWENDKVQAGIAVIDTNTGAVVAIGAGRNRENQVGWNYATMNKRQIGSTAKPLYDYGPLIEYKDASPYHLFYDERYTYSNGTNIKNHDGEFKGFISAREALRISRNIPALKAFQQNENKNIYDFVTKLGLHPETDEEFIHEAHAIGAYGDGQTTGESPLSIAAAYAAFANGGYYTEPYTFTKIVYRNSDEEYIHKPERIKAMSDATAYIVADMLVTGSTWVTTNRTSINGITYGSKTGTSNYPAEVIKAKGLHSNAANDLWVAGICRDYSTAIWYGYDEITDNTGGRGNINLYSELIKGIYTGTPNFTRPSSVVNVTVETKSPGNGQLPSAYTPKDYTVTELYKAGTEPTTVSTKFERSAEVKNQKAETKGNVITLSWNEPDTMNALNRDYLRDLYKDTCKSIDDCVENVYNTDSGLLGARLYKIYYKNPNGTETYIKEAKETNITIDENDLKKLPAGTKDAKEITLIIKAGFVNEQKWDSNGVEIKATMPKPTTPAIPTTPTTPTTPENPGTNPGTNTETNPTEPNGNNSTNP